MSKSLVLFSGGIKSTYIAASELRSGEEVICLFYEHSQSPRELDGAANVAAYYHLPLVRLPLPWPDLFALQRFIYLTFHAIPIARAMNCKMIYHGLSKDDGYNLKQMSVVVDSLQTLIGMAQPRYSTTSQWQQPIELETPLRRVKVEHVIRLGNELDIPWELTRSCLRGETLHCGHCPGCLRRRSAFVREGCDDPTVYTAATR